VNVETTITEELREVGAPLRPPPAPDPATLVRAAGRARTRTLVRSGISAALAAAVILAIVVLGAHLKDPNAAPIPTPEPTVLPTGQPPQIPYIQNETLYVDGQVQPGSWAGVVTHQASSIASLNDFTGTPETWTTVLFHDGSEVARIPHVGGSVLSPAGRRAAWIERDGQDWYVVVYDLERSREQGRWPVDAHTLGHVGPENEGWEGLSAVDDGGVTTWAGALKVHTWTPGSAPVESDQTDPEPPSGQFPVDDAVVSLSPDGAWGVWNEDLTGDQVVQGSTETPDQYNVHVFAQRPGQPGTRIEFPLPSNVNMGGADWETTETFLTQVFDDPTGDTWHYVRCFIATKRCEVAPTP